MLHQTIWGKCKRYGLLGLLILLLILLCSCTAKPSVVGTWRLESGRFSYMSNTYDKCAIEFTDMGEYILYEGDNYENDYYHGSYTFNDKQISMVIDDMFRSSANCTIDGDRMVLVTSRGSATFVRIDTTALAGRFDDSMIRNTYESEGYQVAYVNLTESTENTRIYKTKITQSYQYMDEEIIRQDIYAYSRIGQHWYLENSEEISANENWYVNGIWTYSDGFTPHALRIHSCSSTEAVVDYHISYGFPYSDYDFSGTVPVTKGTVGLSQIEECTRLTFPERNGSGSYTSVFLDKDKGVMKEIGWFEKAFTHLEE